MLHNNTTVQKVQKKTFQENYTFTQVFRVERINTLYICSALLNVFTIYIFHQIYVCAKLCNLQISKNIIVILVNYF